MTNNPLWLRRRTDETEERSGF